MNRDDFVLALGRHSLEAALLVGVVLAVQWIFRKQLGPQWSCALWLVVALRLLPISVPSGFSVFNWLQTPGASHTIASFAEKGERERARAFPPEPQSPQTSVSENVG